MGHFLDALYTKTNNPIIKRFYIYTPYLYPNKPWKFYYHWIEAFWCRNVYANRMLKIPYH